MRNLSSMLAMLLTPSAYRFKTGKTSPVNARQLKSCMHCGTNAHKDFCSSGCSKAYRAERRESNLAMQKLFRDTKNQTKKQRHELRIAKEQEMQLAGLFPGLYKF